MLSGTDALKMIAFAAVGGDEPRHGPKQRDGKLLFGVTTAALLIAACAYWAGARSASDGTGKDVPVSALDRATPIAGLQRAGERASSLISSASPPSQSQDSGDANLQKRLSAAGTNGEEKISSAATHATSAQMLAPDGPLGAHAELKHSRPNATVPPNWMVRVGRFESKSEAEKEWTDFRQRWPDLQSLSAAPVQIRSLRDGKTYYRLQLGTTSPSNSEIVCRRAHDLDQSCSIIAAEEQGAESPL